MRLTDEQALVRDTMRSFAQARLAPQAARWDRESHFPREELRELGGLGAMGMVVPERWGGAAMDYLSLALALEEIAAGDGATSTIVSVQNSVVCGPSRGVRHRLAEGTLARAARARREARLLLPDRAAGGLRRRRDRDAGGAPRRRLRAQRREAVHHHRQACRTSPWCSP